jgi:hypothetical protein
MRSKRKTDTGETGGLPLLDTHQIATTAWNNTQALKQELDQMGVLTRGTIEMLKKKVDSNDETLHIHIKILHKVQTRVVNLLRIQMLAKYGTWKQRRQAKKYLKEYFKAHAKVIAKESPSFSFENLKSPSEIIVEVVDDQA